MAPGCSSDLTRGTLQRHLFFGSHRFQDSTTHKEVRPFLADTWLNCLSRNGYEIHVVVVLVDVVMVVVVADICVDEGKSLLFTYACLGSRIMEESCRRNHGDGTIEEESWWMAPWMRNHGGGIIEEESWRRNHGDGIMEEESKGGGIEGRRNHGEGIMEDESWRRNHEGGIMEEASWKRHHGGGIIEKASSDTTFMLLLFLWML